MSQPTGAIPPYRVVSSERCRQQTRELLERAAAKERFAEIAQVVRDINIRLQWISLGFGEPLTGRTHCQHVPRFAVSVPLRSRLFRQRRGVPDLHRALGSIAGQRLAVRAEGHAADNGAD